MGTGRSLWAAPPHGLPLLSQNVSLCRSFGQTEAFCSSLICLLFSVYFLQSLIHNNLLFRKMMINLFPSLSFSTQKHEYETVFQCLCVAGWSVRRSADYSVRRCLLKKLVLQYSWLSDSFLAAETELLLCRCERCAALTCSFSIETVASFIRPGVTLKYSPSDTWNSHHSRLSTS